MMWAATTEIGCGIANCEVNSWQFLVCQYSPAGNVAGSTMFSQANLDQLRQHEALADCETITTPAPKPDAITSTTDPALRFVEKLTTFVLYISNSVV